MTCEPCGQVRDLSHSAIQDGELAACGWCSTSDLYIQKDFPHALGLGIVITGFVISSVFWYFYMPLSAFATLLATAALDLILYYRVPDVTVCYRCLSQHRGPGSNPAGRYAPFDLSIGERYRQERLRIAELHSHREPAGPVTPS